MKEKSFLEPVPETVVKEETNIVENTNENTNITATTENSPIPVVDETKISQEGLKEDNASVNRVDIQLAEQSKQLEEMKKELEALKTSNKELNDQKTKLENDISSLRENPFYNASKNVSGLANIKTTEYSYEDIRNMRKGI
jgi:septal ring factor EnvC (AmiA/AmiB activator)